MKYFKRFIALPLLLLMMMSMGINSKGDFVTVEEFANLKAIVKVKGKDIYATKAEYSLVDARNKGYKKSHLKGAVNLKLTDIQNEKGVLKSSTEIAKVLGTKGILPTRTVYIYDDGKFKNAGRVYWVLKYMGYKNVKIIDGGMKAWAKARKKVTPKPTKAKAGTATVTKKSTLLAKEADVKGAKGKANVTLIDVRAADEFNGTKETKLKPGHIPGAINIDFNKCLKAGQLKSKAELQKVFASVPSGNTVILYCETSVRAGVVYAALTSVLGYKKVKVYDDAYTIWQEKNGVVK